MAIVLKTIQSEVADGVTALVDHGSHQLTATIVGDPARIRAAVGETLQVELDYAGVVSSCVLEKDLPDGHGLFPLPSGDLRVVGLAHHVVEVSEGVRLVDVYLRTGPEYVTFETSALGCTPTVGDGIEAVVRGLRFFPSWT
jgi:hypothetical protein